MFEEVLEQMLPLCDDDPFEVADWLDDHFKRGKVRLLDDGGVVPPHLYSTHLKVVAIVAADGRASLSIELLRAFECKGQWTVERKSFEASRSNTKRSGRPPTKREWALIEAAAYIVEKGLPNPPTADALYNELAGIHGEQCPSRATAMEVLPSFLRRIKIVLGS